MVTLPAEFIATKYPGYFWNTADNKLYSCKITGELKPLRYYHASRWNHGVAGYRVSVNGNHRNLSINYLKKLKHKKQVFPVAKI